VSTLHKYATSQCHAVMSLNYVKHITLNIKMAMENVS